LKNLIILKKIVEVITILVEVMEKMKDILLNKKQWDYLLRKVKKNLNR
jgi:hypothetical protein